PAARMFRLLGVHPGPDISAAAAASLTGSSLSQARAALSQLTRAHLLAEPGPGRFAVHDLLRAYAAERADAEDRPADRRAAAHRALDHYLHTANAAARVLHPERDALALTARQPGVTPEEFGDYEQAMAWFEAEHRVLLIAVAHADGDGFGTHA